VLISQKTKIFVLTGLPKPQARKKSGWHAAGKRWQRRNSVDSLPETAGEEETRSILCRKPPARKKSGWHAAGNRRQGKNWVGTLPATAGKEKTELAGKRKNGGDCDWEWF